MGQREVSGPGLYSDSRFVPDYWGNELWFTLSEPNVCSLNTSLHFKTKKRLNYSSSHTSSITSSSPYIVHQNSTATRSWPVVSPSGARHHWPVIGTGSLAPKSSPGNVVVGLDLITTAFKNLYVPAK